MKKILFTLAIIAFVFSVSSCGNKKKKESHPEGTHVHSDGTVHADDAHSNDNTANPAQESFEVDKEAEHKHEEGDHGHDGHKHEQGDGEHEGQVQGDEASHDHDHDQREHK